MLQRCKWCGKPFNGSTSDYYCGRKCERDAESDEKEKKAEQHAKEEAERAKRHAELVEQAERATERAERKAERAKQRAEQVKLDCSNDAKQVERAERKAEQAERKSEQAKQRLERIKSGDYSGGGGCGTIISVLVVVAVAVFFWREYIRPYMDARNTEEQGTREAVTPIGKNAAAASSDGKNSVGENSVGYGKSFEYGGQIYKTVKIGDLLWTAQNLNYEPSNGNSWCNNTNCNKYGRLYDWKTAMSVCPSGYHLPTQQEWNNLVATAGGKDVAGRKLKAISGWNENGGGTDDFGFSALPGGGRQSEGVFNDVGDNGRWWTATEYSGSLAYYRSMYYNYDRVGEDYYGKSRGYSVRCVANN